MIYCQQDSCSQTIALIEIKSRSSICIFQIFISRSAVIQKIRYIIHRLSDHQKPTALCSIQCILQIVYMTVVLKFLSARYILRNNYQEKIVIYIYKYESEFLVNPDSKIIIYKIKLLNIVYVYQVVSNTKRFLFYINLSNYAWSILFQQNKLDRIKYYSFVKRKKLSGQLKT